MKKPSKSKIVSYVEFTGQEYAGVTNIRQGGYMYILTNDQINEISGAGLEPVLLAIGAVAGTFKTAYETATWFGADQLGAWLGQGWYQANEICGSGVMALYGK